MILLKNCFRVASLNEKGDEFSNCDILIKENLISKIAPNISLSPEEKRGTEILDCAKFLVLPGMVNTHHHLYQTLTRNLPGAQNAKLFDWLKYLYNIWAKLDADGVYYSTLLGCAELLKTGATTTTDHMYLYPANFDGDIMEIQFRAAEALGIRFSPSRGSMTLGESDGGLPPDSVVQTTDEVLRDMKRVVSEFHDPSPLSMRKIIFAPCSPFSVDSSVMIETAKMARSLGVMLHTHLAETLDEDEFCISKYGKRPLQLMEDWGWLGKDVFFAHGVWFTNNELDKLAQTQTGVAHCPTSNMRLGSGIAKIRQMLDKGVRVGLAVDGSASNDSSDMLGEARNAMLLQRVKYGANGLTAREALKMATFGGADLLGYDKLGKIETGFGADLIMLDMSKLQYAGALSDPVAAIVFAGYDHSVAYSIVNGKFVVRDGKLANYDEEEIISKANEAANRLLK